MKKFFVTTLLSLFVFMASTSGSFPYETGGIVTNEQGEVLPGVRVVIEDRIINKGTVTDDQGRYHFLT